MSTGGRLREMVGAVALLACMGQTACAASGSPTPRAALSPDSAALLDSALRHVRPGYRSQREALLAGVYELPPTAPGAAAPGSHGTWVVQVSAHERRSAADGAAREARRHFPNAELVVESAAGLFRVSVAGWATVEEAAPALREIRRIYPDAWVRKR